MKTLYLHLGWSMPYPFSPRTWSSEEWEAWISLIAKGGVERLMVWPGLEFIDWNSEEELTEMRLRIHAISRACHLNGLLLWMGRSANGFCKAAKRPLDQRDASDLDFLHPNDPQFKDLILNPIEKVFKDVSLDGWWVIDRDPGHSFDSNAEAFAQIMNQQSQATDASRSVHWMWAGWTTNENQPDDWREQAQPFWIEAIRETRRVIKQGLIHLACWPGHIKALDSLGEEYIPFPYHHLEAEPSLPFSYCLDELDRSHQDLAWSREGPWVMNIQTPCLRTSHLMSLLSDQEMKTTEWEDIESNWCWSAESLEKMKKPWMDLERELQVSKPSPLALKHWKDAVSPHPPMKRGLLADRFE